MKIIHKTLIIAILALLVSACATIKGSNPSEQRMNIEKMRTEALAHLYKKHPQARSEIQNAAGYAVFSNRGSVHKRDIIRINLCTTEHT